MVSVHQLDIAKQTFVPFQNENLDTIVSFNVLEHIEDDLAVLKKCAELLRDSRAEGKKRIISFVPAHPWAYGVMDKAVGHYRRYNQMMFKSLHAKSAPEAKLILKPFNYVGLWGWAVNGRILKRDCAGSQVIGLFNRLCPLFKLMDSIFISKLGIPLGQSLIAIQEWC